MPKSQRKIFIDCGAHDGCSVRKTIDTRPDGEDYEFYCFEINKDFEPFFEDLADYKVEFINKAAIITDAMIPFLKQGMSGGSTIDSFKSHTLVTKQFHREECMLFDLQQIGKVSHLEHHEVQGSNIVKWIEKNFTQNDYIVFKLDVEGAEFDILPAMLQNNMFEYIDEFLVEFHCYTLEENQLRDIFLTEIKAQNKEIIIDTEWDAMYPPYLKNTECEEYYRETIRENINFRGSFDNTQKKKIANIFLDEHCQDIKDLSSVRKNTIFSTKRDFQEFRLFLNENNLVEEWKKHIIDIGLEKIKI